MTPVHDHLAWGLVGLYRGTQDEEFYRPRRYGSSSNERRPLAPGDFYALLPPRNDVHRVRTHLARWRSVSIHLLANDTGVRVAPRLRRGTGEARPFRSGYVNAVCEEAIAVARIACDLEGEEPGPSDSRPTALRPAPESARASRHRKRRRRENRALVLAPRRPACSSRPAQAVIRGENPTSEQDAGVGDLAQRGGWRRLTRSASLAMQKVVGSSPSSAPPREAPGNGAFVDCSRRRRPRWRKRLRLSARQRPRAAVEAETSGGGGTRDERPRTASTVVDFKRSEVPAGSLRAQDGGAAA